MKSKGNEKKTVQEEESEERQVVKPQLRFPEFQNSEGWELYFGGDLFDQISNKDHDSKLPILAISQDQGAVPRSMINYHVSVTDKSIESYKVVEVDDFIISLRSFQGGIEHSAYKGICSPAYVILRDKRNNHKPYYKHIFKSKRFIDVMTRNIEGLRDGKMVSYKQFSELKIPLPPVEEQKKIAECLSSIDELITAQTQKLELLKEHKKGLMQQLFPAEGETEPKLRIDSVKSTGGGGE
jgi:type I restriction enzyme, S subunit